MNYFVHTLQGAAILLCLCVIAWAMGRRRARKDRERVEALPACKHGARGIERRNCPACKKEAEEYFSETKGAATINAVTDQGIVRVPWSHEIDSYGDLAWPWFAKANAEKLKLEAMLPKIEPRFRIGQWVRYKGDGVLSLITHFDSSAFPIRVSSPVNERGSWHAGYTAIEIEPAAPRAREVWRMVKNCSRHYFRLGIFVPIKDGWDTDISSCGCVCEPVNFGRGNG